MTVRNSLPDLTDEFDSQIALSETALLQFGAEHPALRCLLLIDPARRNPEGDWEADHPTIASRRLPIGLHESLFPPHHRPCLYPLDLESEPDRAVLKSCVRMAFEDWQPDSAIQALGHRVCGWLWLPRENEDSVVAAHLGKQVVQYDLERNGRILLRYFDPRIIDLLWPSFSPDQRQAALGPVRFWLFIDRSRTLLSLPNPAEDGETGYQRLSLNASQWSLARRIGLINQTLARWQGMHPQPIPASLPADVDDAVRQATLYGLHEEQDLIEFAWLAISSQLRFAEHPAFQPVFAAVRSGESFVSALASLTPEHWQRIVAGTATS